MDHHCPWTANCVSHTTFPHFLRFLLYAVLSMTYLFNLLFPRLQHLWAQRNMPSYLGPSISQLAHLFLLTTVNFFVLFALTILLVRNVYALAVNTTTIEGWEIERHETLLRRARVFGGVLEGPDGVRVRITRQEFPYDVGIWENVKQGMGSGNPVNMLNPLSGTPRLATKLTYPTNGFSDLPWPPPDPDRTYYRSNVRGSSTRNPEEGFTYRDAGLSNAETVAAFRQRQRDDEVRRRKPFVERLEEEKCRQERLKKEQSYYDEEEEEEEEGIQEVEEQTEKRRGTGEGEESWRNAEGERLRDFGVDEDAEFYDEARDGDGEDDVPLSELLARKRGAAAAAAASQRP
jgi:palmitoyltransferase